MIRLIQPSLRKSCCDTPDTSEQSGSQVKANEAEAKLLRDYIEDLYRYLDVDPGNVNLVNTDLFKVKKSKSEVNQ